MNSLLQDIRYGARSLAKNPGFTFIAILALALGIGANTSLFTVVSAVLLRPLPFPEAERLVQIKAVNVKAKTLNEFGGVAPADFLDWKQQQTSFERIAAYTGGTTILTDGEQPEQIVTSRVSADFFATLGARPMLGRLFAPEEYRLNAARVLLISHAVWQRRFGGDKNVVGKSITLADGAGIVVGVMPPEMREPWKVEAWQPFPEDSSETKLRSSRYFPVVGRLKSGVTREQAEAEMRTITARLAEAHPTTNANWSARVVDLKESLVGSVRPALLVLLGAVLFVLLIACANVANLLLARSLRRQKEIAIRAALGASRWRVIRGLLIESVMLALAGGAAGLVLAWWGVDALKALIPESMRFPRLEEVGIDGRVLLFTMLVSVLTGIVFGLVPGWQVSKPDLQESLKENSRGATGNLRTQRTRALLVVSQIALTLLLLVGAGLLVRSFIALQRIDPGFDPENLVTFSINTPKNVRPMTEASANYFAQVSERIANVPGVAGVAMTSGAPLTIGDLAFPFAIEGATISTTDTPQAGYTAVTPNYFRVMNIPMRQGREFTDTDKKDAPRACIINETMARRYFPANDWAGKRIKVDYLDAPTLFEIVGVAADSKRSTLNEKADVALYVPQAQQPWFSTALLVRTKADPDSATQNIKQAVWSLNPTQPLNITRMDELLGNSVAEPRLYGTLLAVFSFTALALAAVGLYGVISYTVAQRTHEIGVRLALGARTTDILRLVIGQGMKLTFVGVLVGVASALALTRVASSLLYGVSANDPATFSLVALLLTFVAALACYIPARRATKINPTTALRYE